MRLFDLHCDTLSECMENHYGFDDQRLSVTIGDNLQIFEPWKQVFVLWTPDNVPKGENRNHGRRLLDTYYKMLDSYPGKLTRGNALLALENSELLDDALTELPFWKEKGVCYITLTWNGQNRAAGGCQSDGGLTDFGKRLLAQMAKLNIAVDLSHLNDKSFYEVIEQAQGPVLASHSNLRSVCGHRRNLTEEQFSLILQRGGMVGLTFCDYFLKEGGAAGLEDIWRHLYRFYELGGEKSLCLGSDYDGAPMPKEIANSRDLPQLWEFLLKKGLSEEQCDALFYQNAADYFEKTFQHL